MKFKWDKKYLYVGVTAFTVIVASIIFYFSMFKIDEFASWIRNMSKILTPIIYGIIIAYLLTPIMNFFEKKVINKLIQKYSKVKVYTKKQKKFSRVISLILTFILAIFIIYELFNLLLPQLVESIVGLVDNLPTYYDSATLWLNNMLKDNPTLDNMVNNLFDQSTNMIDTWLKGDILPKINKIVLSLSSSVFDVISVFKNLIIGIIISIYLLFGKEKFAGQIKRLLFIILDVKTANSVINLSREANKIFGGFISGKILDSVIIGIICFVVTNILGMPYVVLVSVIVGVTNIIPFFGPFIGAIPSAVLIFLVDPLKCLSFIIFIIILQQFDGNILGPKILGGSTGLSSFSVIFAILVGGGLYGFIGMVCGVPVFAVICVLFKRLASKILEVKNLPEDLEIYMDKKENYFEDKKGKIKINKKNKGIVKKEEDKEYS